MATVSRFPLFQRTGFPQNCNVFAVYNPFTIGLTAGMGEEWAALQCKDGVGNVIFETKPRPFFGGTLQFDIAPLLQTGLLIRDWTTNTRFQGTFEVAESYQFKLYQRTNIISVFTEITSFGGTITTPFLAVIGANQLGYEYGNTLAEYCPLVSGGVVTQKGTFLTRFEDIQLFWYSSVAEPSMSTEVTVFYPGILLPLFDNTTQRTAVGAIYMTDFAGVQFAVGIDTPLEQLAHVEIPDAENWIFDRPNGGVLKVGQGTNPALPLDSEIFAQIKVFPRRVCSNPYAIKWLNSLGGFDVWVFDVARSPSVLETESDGGIFGIAVDDIATATATANSYAKDSSSVVTLFADQLTQVQVTALQEILYSPLVMLYVGEYVNNIDADKWHGVVVETQRAEATDTYDPIFKFELEIRLPSIYHPNN